ncbi:BTB/POZ domain-containing protein At1g04390 isoform X2 [Andrographis paniculata]|nr:BTB/POZ domain-containing protein At1g04390 isoform X2 [Andrographis paniculata]
MRALESIIQFKNQSILKLALDIAVKMVNILPSSTLQSHVLDLICPLVDLLSYQQLQVVISCATTLNIILSKLSSRQDREAWQILKESKAVVYLVQNIKLFYTKNQPIEYFQEMASLLSKMLWQWPSFRFCAWNDPIFLDVLDAVKLRPENSVKVVVLQLYSSLALCGNGADKLLENGESLLQMTVGCMDRSNTDSVRFEAFKLARCLVLTRRGCINMMNIYCEPLVNALTSTLSNWSSQPEEVAKSQRPIIEEALRLASITRWAGNHHVYFWRMGMDRVLVNLLLDNYHKIHQLRHELSVNELIIIVRECRNSILPLSYRPFIWDILGGLAANCSENINHEMHGNKLRLNILIISACFSFVNSIRTLRQITQNGLVIMSDCESASRAVLMMVYSPCKHIASLSRSILHEILKLHARDHTEYLLDIVNARLTRNKFGLPGNLQTVISLVCLACYCSLPEYGKHIIKLQGLKTVVAFIVWWFQNPVCATRASAVLHLVDAFSQKSCCVPDTDEWEGDNGLLLYSLWILGQLLHHSPHLKIHLSDGQLDFSEAKLIQNLQEICRSKNSQGSKWYAAYMLSYFELYGFPSRLGNRIGELLGEREDSDLKLDIVDEESVFVHEVILTVRCPSLLPPQVSTSQEMISTGISVKLEAQGRALKAIRLSAHVDHQILLKLLEYVYFGHLQASEDLVKKLKILARHCQLGSLVQLLCKKVPKWGASIPIFDLSLALGAAGYCFSDVILEASTTELVDWKCSFCSASAPHLHVHRVILASSCNYLRALFYSGMRDSHLQTIKVPVSWESLTKLVNWFYSDQLPVPEFDCRWDNMDPEKKFQEVHTYLELCWLAEFWLVEDLYKECYEVVASCLDSSRFLSTRIIQIAADFSLWKLAQVAADYMAPSYHQLRNSGELDALDNSVIEMVRAASVRLSQVGKYQ